MRFVGRQDLSALHPQKRRIVRGLWREAVIEKDAQGRERVNRITYEICVLEVLREQLR
jgi:hypothetical protein